MSIVYFEGKFLDEEEAKVPISDRGFQFGDGAFAVVQVRDGTPLFLESHLEQLKKQCTSFKLNMPPVAKSVIEELIERNQANEGIWRLKIIVTGGDSSEGCLPLREGRVIAFLKPFTPLPFKPLKMGIFTTPYSTCHAFFKSLAHLNRLYVMEEALAKGLDDCVTTTESGIILEAAFGNLFWVKERTVLTPDPSLPLYFGITIKNVLKIAKDLGFEVQYIKSILGDLPEQASAFRTNTMQGIRPISQLGSRHFDLNSVVLGLFTSGYEALIRKEQGENKKAQILV